MEHIHIQQDNDGATGVGQDYENRQRMDGAPPVAASA